MNFKINQKSTNSNSFITSNISQNVSQNKSKTNSLSPDLGHIQKTKFIEYVNKKLITKSEDLKQTQITKSKNSYNSSFSNTIHNKIKPSSTSSHIISSNNINGNSTINNYISASKHSPISLISSNFTNNPNSSFNLKHSLNLGTQKTTPTLNNNIPIFINPTASGDNFKVLSKKYYTKDKSIGGIINDPRFSNLETSDQEEELKLIATKKSEIEKKIFQLKKQAKTKSRSTNTKIGINKSVTTTAINNNNINFTTNNDSFSNNLKTETINDKIIQNTFIQDNLDERKMTEYINYRNNNNNDTFFSNTDNKLTTTNNIMMIDTHLIPDEIFQNDQRFKDIIDKNLSIYKELNILRKNNEDLNTAIKILNNYVQVIQNRNFSKEKESKELKEKYENEKKHLNEENKYLHKMISELKLKMLRTYQTMKLYEYEDEVQRIETSKLSEQLLKENKYLRNLNEKIVFNSCITEKDNRSNSENSRPFKTNDEIINEFKKNRKRNQSELNCEYMNNSSMNTSIIKESTNSRINKFMFSKKDFLFEEMNNIKPINTNDINLNFIKYGDTIKNINPSSNDILKTRKQYLFLKTPKGLSNL